MFSFSSLGCILPGIPWEVLFRKADGTLLTAAMPLLDGYVMAGAVPKKGLPFCSPVLNLSWAGLGTLSRTYYVCTVVPWPQHDE